MLFFVAHVPLDVMLLYRLMSDFWCRCCSFMSQCLDLPVSLFLSNFPIVIRYSSWPFLIMYPKNVDCLLQTSAVNFIIFKIFSCKYFSIIMFCIIRTLTPAPGPNVTCKHSICRNQWVNGVWITNTNVWPMKMAKTF